MNYGIFKDSDGSFSWRAASTFVILIIFAFAAIGYLFGLPILPKAYLAIIGGVILFYFGKRYLEKRK